MHLFGLLFGDGKIYFDCFVLRQAQMKKNSNDNNNHSSSNNNTKQENEAGIQRQHRVECANVKNPQTHTHSNAEPVYV